MSEGIGDRVSLYTVFGDSGSVLIFVQLCITIVYMLQRTQLMLDDQLKRDLLMLAEMKNQSMSQLVRTYVSAKVQEEKKKVRKRKAMSGVDALLKMAEAAEKIDKKYGYSGPTDVSVNHDHYLYGSPKKQQ